MDRATQVKLYDELREIPMLDIHTHMDANHLTARGLHDILLYHMVISELYSAGCPDGARLSENPDEDEALYRLERAVPYIKHIRNTSCYWGVKIILRDLYNVSEDIDEDNWLDIHRAIKEIGGNKDFAVDIAKKARIKRICTELWRGHGGLCDDIFQYGLEWAFFTRNQWGQYDTALLELEHAWNQNEPGSPLPVTSDRSLLNFKKTIQSMDDVKAAIKYYCAKIPYDKILSTASHLSTDIKYMDVSDADMSIALKNRINAGEWERNVYANYINQAFINEIESSGKDIVLQYSIGAEPLPFETGSKLKTDTVFELAGLISKHRNAKFSFFLSSLHQNQAFCTLAREFPNVSLAGYWWHNFFPNTMRQIMNERLDMVVLNRQFGFFSDAYCMEWAYAKSILIRKQMAEVLALKIDQGQYTFSESIDIARTLFYETAKNELRMEDGEILK